MMDRDIYGRPRNGGKRLMTAILLGAMAGMTSERIADQYITSLQCELCAKGVSKEGRYHVLLGVQIPCGCEKYDNEERKHPRPDGHSVCRKKKKHTLKANR